MSSVFEGGGYSAADMADIAALGRPLGWAVAARRLLSGLGFCIVHAGPGHAPGSPAGTGETSLLVALRAAPTMRHFDPETVMYWSPVEGRGRDQVLTRATRLPLESPFLWGDVRLIDRLHVENRFLTFGGTLRAASIDDDETVVALRSPGPLARWSGHSQGVDVLTAEIGAFFARLLVRVDFEPGVEATLATTPPNRLYAAFVRDAHHRLASNLLRTADDPFAHRTAQEMARLHATEPEAWAAGSELLVWLGMSHGS